MSALHPTSSVDSTPTPFAAPDARRLFAAICGEMAKNIAWQTLLVEQLLLTILCRGHAMVVGAAGSGKWQAVMTLGHCLGLSSQRLLCSADLHLDDFSGRGVCGPLWQSSLLHLDAYDRLAPKLGNLIQHVMSEHVVENGQEEREVPDPFVVFATRLPPDEPSTYEPAIDELAMDRFLFQILVPYPAYQAEFLLATRRSGPASEPPRQVVSLAELNAWRALVPQVIAPPSVVHYAVRLVRATRVHEGENPDFIYEWLQRGAGPRAAHSLVLAARARASLYGRLAACHADVRALAEPVLRHRILTNRNARANGIDADRVIRRLLDEVPARIAGDESVPLSGTGFTFHDWVPLDEDPE